MSMPATVNAYSVYIESTVVIDIADSTSPRHHAAMDLLRIFQRHRRSGSQQLVTSSWTLAEAHGVLYGKALERQNIPPPRRGNRVLDVRNIFPPKLAELAAADKLISPLLQMLQTSTFFALWPQATEDSTPIWQLVRRIGQETAIWPQDSVHLAAALFRGCSMLITDDVSFLDRIDYCQQSLIAPYRQAEFSYLGSSLPPFLAHGLVASRRHGPTQKRPRRTTALQELQALGF